MQSFLPLLQKSLLSSRGPVSRIWSMSAFLSQRRCSSVSHDKAENKSSSDRASLYIHWPYCSKRCTYCNFNKYISKNVDHERMKQCLVIELDYLLNASAVNEITSIFFGGGTPSLANPSTIQAVIDTVKRKVQLSHSAEVSLEVNPTRLEAGKLRDFREAGINRISLGIQALDDKDLRLLGRNHSTAEALSCLETAKALYPEHVSVDFIFGRPSQTVESWKKELDQILAVCDSHISLYRLGVERGTQLFKWIQNKSVILPNDDLMADLYSTAVKKLEESGFMRYDVINFAKKVKESRHNIGYLNGQQYIGVGPGAHGRFIPKGLGCEQREWRVQTLEPEYWMREVELYGHATRTREALSQRKRLLELLMFGLRMTDGISSEMWSELSEESFKSVFGDVDEVQNLIEEGLVVMDSRHLRASDKGLAVLENIVPVLIQAWGLKALMRDIKISIKDDA